MTHYSYYQNAAPTWGTQQYQFTAPPQPTYQPQPSWQGQDYYRAHAGNYDNTVFDYAWSKVKNFVSGGGVGKDEARLWHRRAYGGLGDVRQMLPSEVGAAAAYEAWRSWKHHYGIYGQPLSDDRERQREALIGLAIGEATRLWGYTGRPADKYGRLEASEAAAATISRIFREKIDFDGYGGYDNGYSSYSRRSSSRPRSHSRSRSSYGDYSDDYDRSGYPRSYSRPRRSSFSSVMPGTPYAGAVSAPIAIPGAAPPMTYGQPSYSGSAPGAYGPLQNSYGSQYGGTSPYAGTQPLGSQYGGASPYNGSQYGGASPYSGSQYGGASPYSGSQNAGSYGTQQYPGQSVGLPVPPGTVVIHSPHRSRRHSHSHGHRRHHRSNSYHRDPAFISAVTGYGY